jgi:small subunit ribosomal protein S7
MPRRREVPKRKVIPDPLYSDQLVTKFMNCVMLDGKKAIAEKIVYGAFEIIQERTREEPLKIFHKALENCQPMVEVKSRRVGGANYQVPVEVSNQRKMALSMRWLIQYAC